ncbi:XrtA/PEP-CTERM system-associated ATPase [Erythrobacter sp.]|jgi:putative secretion ATPase (PEP-CTERM system associated)|uniref:XrtA/PEP-CTERM system-associated ATPase n=1 Tax=Erythrobacter sp. TaxID=1042 RepID=UPI002EBC358F|nr:XrtA/PEP-CTERM system-associated ATPase [Erythrobacter sp.]
MHDQYYGFTARPFQLTPDPAFYFESASHRKALSYLGYGMNQAEGFIVITGEVGAGKSTLVELLLKRLDPEHITAAQIVTSALDAGELVHIVADAFGLEVAGHDKAAALGAIERFLQDEARAGRRCLLIVDECQNLDLAALEELRMLSNFQLGAHPLLQSLLLGQPEFRRTLARHPDLEQLRQRIIASHHLEAMEADEVAAYIRHRLEQAGWEGRPALDDSLLPAVHEAAAGIPRRVNQIMNRLLLLGTVEERDALTTDMLGRVLAEMADDQTRGASPEPSPLSIEPAEHAQTLADEVPAMAGHVPAREVAALLAQRDSRTAELEAAISELQRASVDTSGDLPASPRDLSSHPSLERIEGRLDEQEASLRHVLTMLIEWLEDGLEREAA